MIDLCCELMQDRYRAHIGGKHFPSMVTIHDDMRCATLQGVGEASDDLILTMDDDIRFATK